MDYGSTDAEVEALRKEVQTEMEANGELDEVRSDAKAEVEMEKKAEEALEASRLDPALDPDLDMPDEILDGEKEFVHETLGDELDDSEAGRVKAGAVAGTEVDPESPGVSSLLDEPFTDETLGPDLNDEEAKAFAFSDGLDLDAASLTPVDDVDDELPSGASTPSPLDSIPEGEGYVGDDSLLSPSGSPKITPNITPDGSVEKIETTSGFEDSLVKHELLKEGMSANSTEMGERKGTWDRKIAKLERKMHHEEAMKELEAGEEPGEEGDDVRDGLDFGYQGPTPPISAAPSPIASTTSSDGGGPFPPTDTDRKVVADDDSMADKIVGDDPFKKIDEFDPSAPADELYKAAVEALQRDDVSGAKEKAAELVNDSVNSRFFLALSDAMEKLQESGSPIPSNADALSQKLHRYVDGGDSLVPGQRVESV